jgi:uncharacterized membrane protein
MNSHPTTHEQEQHERLAQHAAYAHVAVFTIGSALGIAAVLWIAGLWSFSLDFILKYGCVMVCAVLIQEGVLWVSFRTWLKAS